MTDDRDYDTLAAKLAAAERVARYESDIAQQALDQMRAAEAALPAVYRLALEDAAERLLAAVTREYKDHRDYRKAIRCPAHPNSRQTDGAYQ